LLDAARADGTSVRVKSAFEEQRLAGWPRQGTRKAVADVEAGRMLTLANAAKRIDRNQCLLRCDAGDFDAVVEAG
jgi:hypothetical protein